MPPESMLAVDPNIVRRVSHLVHCNKVKIGTKLADTVEEAMEVSWLNACY